MLKNLRNISPTARKPFTYKRQIALLIFGIIGFIVAGAWVLAFNTLILHLAKGQDEILAYFIYSIVVTIVAIFLIWIIVKATDHWEV